MTTGEKIAKIRKEHNLTQEELGDLLGVTRQSVSKWESDMSFPETEKLILIAKQFKCSLDYLLNNEYNNITITNQKTKKLDGNLVDSIAVMSYASLLLIFYLLPFARISVTVPGIVSWDTSYISFVVNFYKLVFSQSYEVGNIICLLHFMCTLFTLGIGVLLLFFKDKRLYKGNFILSIISTVTMILIIVFVIEFENPISSGVIFIIMTNIIYMILILIKKRKAKKLIKL